MGNQIYQMFKTTISACALFAVTSMAKDASQHMVQHLLKASLLEPNEEAIKREAISLASGRRNFGRSTTTVSTTETKNTIRETHVKPTVS